MAGIKFEINPQLEIKVQKAIEAGLTAGTIEVRNRAVKNCPVGETGKLRASIYREVRGNTGIIYNTMKYAPFVEFGHTLRNGKWWEGRHFMRRALFENWKDIEIVINNVIRSYL